MRETGDADRVARPVPGGFGATGALCPTPHGLPRPLTSLVGRAGVVEAVSDALRRARVPLLTLTGPGGVGKTRLAIAAAERAVSAFADGMVFVDLAPLPEPDLVLTAIAKRLGVDERHPAPLPELVTAVLGRRQLLLILDNFEHVLPARDQVLDLIQQCPQLVVLVTSRVPLRVRGEREFRVAPLELPGAGTSDEAPAVQLFLDRARDAGGLLMTSATDVMAIAEVCRRLDGLPLAIELAAAWTRMLSPQALVAHLELRLPLLVGGPHDLPARQRTMRDAIAWSYDLLDAREQRLFRRLSVFLGGFTPDAAASVCPDPDADVEPTQLSDLASLVERSLLRPREDHLDSPTEPRLTMLETLREFGQELLVAHQEIDETRRRHAAYYVALAEAAETRWGGPSMGARNARLARDHDNLRVALAWLVERGDATAALGMTGALWRYWAARGDLGEGRRWLQAALNLPAEATSDVSAARAKALAGAASLAIAHGHLNEADVLSAQAVALARDLDNHHLRIATLNVHGILALQRNAHEEATRRHEEALELASVSGERDGVAAALTGLANIASRTGDLNRAQELFTHSLVEYRAVGSVQGIAETLKNLCFLAMYAGAYDEAERLGSEALGHHRTEGDSGAIAETLWALGVSAQCQGHDDRALLLHQESLTLRQNRGDERNAAKSLAALGAIAMRRTELRKARTLLIEALIAVRAHDDRHGQALVLTLLGHVALSEGNPRESQACLSESASLFQAIGNPLYLPWCLEGLAGLAAEQGCWEQAAGLSGARDALRAALGSNVPAADPVRYAQTLTRSREALGGDAFARAFEVGGTRSLAGTLAVAGRVVPTT